MVNMKSELMKLDQQIEGSVLLPSNPDFKG